MGEAAVFYTKTSAQIGALSSKNTLKLPAMVIKLPAMVIKLPAMVINLPAMVINLPAMVIKLPAMVINLPAMVMFESHARYVAFLYDIPDT